MLDKPIRHTGPWGMATLEVCLAIMSRRRKEKKFIYLIRFRLRKKINAGLLPVIPAQAGIQVFSGNTVQPKMDAGLRRHDEKRTDTS